MIAALPMYDRPETAAANDRLWQAIRAVLGYGPDHLTRGTDMWDIWLSPELVLAQTCGYPYRSELLGKVQLAGTPAYGIECAAGFYYSVFVVRRDDPRLDVADYADARFAYNEAMSQSGWAAPYTYAASRGFAFSDRLRSGAHVASARMVAEGAADIAALDAVSAKMMYRWDGFAENLRIIAHTEPTPALPMITSLGRDDTGIRNAVAQAIAEMSRQDREDLCLSGFTSHSLEAYLSVANPPSP